MTRIMTSVLLAGAMFCALARPALADNEKGTATIKGKVVFDGTPPKAQPLPPMKADPVCEKAHSNPQADQSTIVYTKAGNTIPYVFVYIKSGIKGKYDAPSEPVVIDQKGCVYHPHVQGMMAGQPIQVKNDDPTNHNIHALPTKNGQFNFAQAQQGMTKDLKGNDTFNKPEIMVKIKCDVHSWMSSYIGVVAHPFFSVTKSHDDASASDAEKGTFEIKNVPAGEYEVEAWHEVFGKVTEKVTVKDGETKEITFKMKK
jgi:plastocyanin